MMILGRLVIFVESEVDSVHIDEGGVTAMLLHLFFRHFQRFFEGAELSQAFYVCFKQIRSEVVEFVGLLIGCSSFVQLRMPLIVLRLSDEGLEVAHGQYYEIQPQSNYILLNQRKKYYLLAKMR